MTHCVLLNLKAHFFHASAVYVIPSRAEYISTRHQPVHIYNELTYIYSGKLLVQNYQWVTFTLIYYLHGYRRHTI